MVVGSSKQDGVDPPITYDEVCVIVYDWINQILDSYKITRYAFCKETGYDQGSLSKFFKDVESGVEVRNLPSSLYLIRAAYVYERDLPDFDGLRKSVSKMKKKAQKKKEQKKTKK